MDTPEASTPLANTEPEPVEEGTPEAAAETSETKPLVFLDRHECRSCGYIYEPNEGDPRRQIAAGTVFEEVPSNWRCPICGSPRSQFRNIGPKGIPSGFSENLGYGLGVNTLTPGQKNLLIFGALGLAVLFFLSLYGLN
ncbi:rubredoxin [Synechococcus elongatus]|uniref:Rubredoxin n=2 Tax=Synechococcus elongatus TaxID=32046 RepID=Q8KPP5_SYNE7|nr:rubredoxin [Synechococcus elongatus]AAM82725.1 RubR [Synechococcus elongatus PCC 7942 = FACHB-805]ABB57209.1 rubredoxin [Synechococcus elongatus PCC 7942 = FACHB-805]AJD58278.1 rubredoxin [Synechococcus elongatus UTEX 2973]MBD2587614.1 rubredoxin [Synechococcus elongatus FACHB-242]MBD2688607.1 rubredoxin [Synechococcus elongatus FACHB-1061]